MNPKDVLDDLSSDESKTLKLTGEVKGYLQFNKVKVTPEFFDRLEYEIYQKYTTGHGVDYESLPPEYKAQRLLAAQEMLEEIQKWLKA